MLQFRLALFWMVVVLGALGGNLQAQFMTNVTLNKSNFLAYEGIAATVTISNRSGGDAVMRGPDGMTWLTFDITDPRGRKLSAMQAMVEENFVIKSGATIRRTINLSQNYSFGEAGRYLIGTSVYHAASGQYFASNKALANVSNVRPFWEQNYGVPVGMTNAGQIRKYSLSVLRDNQHTHLYVRVSEERTGLNIGTYSVGTVIMVMPPQVQVDQDNNLHVFYMTMPRIFVHVTVNPLGKEVHRTYYRETEKSRPQLVTEGNQGISVRGGVIHDPSSGSAEPQKQGRSIGVKPPGL